MYYNHKDGVTLRKMGAEDVHDLYNLKKGWSSVHNTLIVNKEDQARWHEHMPCSQLAMIAMVYGQGWENIGISLYSDIDWIGRTLSLSGSIYNSWRSRPIAKKAFACGLDFAFEILNMHRVTAEVLVTNTPVQYLDLDYLKFEVEGKKRKAVYKAGQYYDSLVLGMLREDWDKHSRVLAYGGSCCKDFDHEEAGLAINRFSRDRGEVSVSLSLPPMDVAPHQSKCTSD